MSAGTAQEETKQEEIVTELMEVPRRDQMRAAGWRVIKIDRRQITWRRDGHVPALSS